MQIEQKKEQDTGLPYLEIARSGVFQLVLGIVVVVSGIVSLFMLNDGFMIFLGLLLLAGGAALLWFAEESVIIINMHGESYKSVRRILRKTLTQKEEIATENLSFLFYHIENRIEGKEKKRKKKEENTENGVNIGRLYLVYEDDSLYFLGSRRSADESPLESEAEELSLYLDVPLNIVSDNDGGPDVLTPEARAQLIQDL